MLQQTRVEAARDYYRRFMQALPDVTALAAADEETVLKLWQGLGYYSRARNMQRAARIIVDTYGGVFPTAYADIRRLPGIGDYTAGAICSICYGQPEPAVDGNVLRVMARLRDDEREISAPATKRDVTETLRRLYRDVAGGDAAMCAAKGSAAWRNDDASGKEFAAAKGSLAEGARPAGPESSGSVAGQGADGGAGEILRETLAGIGDAAPAADVSRWESAGVIAADGRERTERCGAPSPAHPAHDDVPHAEDGLPMNGKAAVEAAPGAGGLGEGVCGDLTQALIELGALICLPAKPRCADCPVAAFCRGRARGTAAKLPVRAAKKPRRREARTVFYLVCGDRLAVRRRPAGSLLGGLFELPQAAQHLTAAEAVSQAEAWGCRPVDLQKSIRYTHVFTHVEWDMICYYITCAAAGDGIPADSSPADGLQPDFLHAPGAAYCGAPVSTPSPNFPNMRSAATRPGATHPAPFQAQDGADRTGDSTQTAFSSADRRGDHDQAVSASGADRSIRDADADIRGADTVAEQDASADADPTSPTPFRWVTPAQLRRDIPLPSAFRPFIEAAEAPADSQPPAE